MTRSTELGDFLFGCDVWQQDGVGVTAQVDSDQSRICNADSVCLDPKRFLEAGKLPCRGPCGKDGDFLVSEGEYSYVRISEDVRQNHWHDSFPRPERL